MNRPLRRLLAAALVAGSFAAVAPAAQASIYCRQFVIENYFFQVCI